jgi:hypothetical protein
MRVGLGWVATHGRIGPGYAHTKGPKARYKPENPRGNVFQTAGE